MARIRTIKPEFYSSEQIAECSPTARLLFIGIWSFSDDGGVHPASLKRLKMEVFPGDEFTMEQMSGWIGELKLNGLLTEFEAEGQTYWQVTGWHHQKIEKPSYRHPQLNFANHSANGRRTVDDDSPPERSRIEGSLNTVGGAASENFEIQESEDAVRRILCSVEASDLRSVPDLMAICDALVAANPKKFKAGEPLRLRIVQAAEASLAKADNPAAFFNAILKAKNWGVIGQEYRTSGEAKFEAWKSRMKESTNGNSAGSATQAG